MQRRAQKAYMRTLRRRAASGVAHGVARAGSEGITDESGGILWWRPGRAGSVQRMDTETPLTVEAALVRRAAAGDAAALTELVNRYRESLYVRVRRIVGDHHVADELLQETFVRLWKHAREIDPDRSPGAWLTTVATRLALSFIRRRRRERPTVPLDETRLAAPCAEAVAREEEEGVVRLKRVREAMEAMDGMHREALRLRVQQKLSYRQMAEYWGCSIGTVMSRLYRARMALRASLGESI